MNSVFGTIGYAVLGGILPALLWLIFWLREDRLHPEPKRLLFRSFLYGMVVVPFVIPFQRLAASELSTLPMILLTWAAIEEMFKFGAAYYGGIRTKEYNEPIDALIYMITAALGFAALENVLFLVSPLQDGNLLTSLLTGNIRFIGATLLHTVTSGIIGISLAISFTKPRRVKAIWLIGAFVLSTALHTLFNLFIIDAAENYESLFVVFVAVWVAVIGLILAFERIKRINVANLPYAKKKKIDI